MAQPRALAISGYGTNCERETVHALTIVGAQAEIVHINDLVADPETLANYQLLVFVGGFSYGDDTGAGNAFANRVRANLGEEVQEFVGKGNLALGICNGFQVMTQLGMFSVHGSYGNPEVALTHNDSARFIDRWVDLEVTGKGPWFKGIETLSLPIAHGEGRFYARDEVLEGLDAKGMVALRYIRGEICDHLGLPANPNGSENNIAGVTNEAGTALGLMPHPERALVFTHRPDWTLLKEMYKRSGRDVPEHGPGKKILENAVKYFE